MRRILSTFFAITLAAALAQRASTNDGTAAPEAPLALDGTSPVELIDSGTTVKGDWRYMRIYMGYRYNFANAASVAKFDVNPDRYNVRLSGYCPVALAAGKGVKGDPSIFVIFDHRIFICQDEVNKALFEANPSRYVSRQPEPVYAAPLRVESTRGG